MTPDRTPCIVGVGTTPFRDLYRNLDPSRTSFQLGVDAFINALADSGLQRGEIDGVVVGRIPSYIKLCADLGLNDLRYVNWQWGGGFQSGLALLQAAMLIETGAANTVACIYGNNGRSVRVEYGGNPIPTSRYDDPYGMTSNGAYLSMAFRRHQHEFGTPNEALAALAISTREHARLNPNAIMQEPMTEKDYFASRFVAEPLRLLDYCLINDGGVAYIVTSLERARHLPNVPVRVISSGSVGAMRWFYGTEDFWYANLRELSGRLFGKAGLRPDDVDCAQIYDNFTPSVLFGLEGMGFCEQGEGGDWLLAGNSRLGGKMPINTAGGHLSEAYLQGWALTVEGVRQLRGQAGPRQVEHCDVVLDLTCSPICTAHLLAR